MIRTPLLICAVMLLLVLASSAPTVALPQTDQPPTAPNNQVCLNLFPNYTPRQHWTLNTPMPTARFAFALIAPNGLSTVYAIGGLQSWTDALTANERYNTCTATWDTLAPLPAPRGYIQAAELNGRLYIVGGVDHVISGTFGVQSNTWVFDPAHNWWSVAAELPQALGGVAVAAADGKLYAFGGFDARGPGAGDVDTVYEYDPAKDRWQLRSTLPGGPGSQSGAAASNGEIHVAGGTSGMLYGSVRHEVYNPTTRLWRTARTLGESFYGFSLVNAPDGFLYALGGSHDHDNGWITAQRYDPAADTWSYLDADVEINDYINHGLSSGAYAAGRVFIIGGEGTRAGYPSDYTLFSNTVESLRVADSLCESSVQATPEAVTAGDHITYTIELHGEVTPLPNVILLDPVPVGTTFDGFITQPAHTTFNNSANQVEWSGPLAASPDPITITFRVAVNNTGWISSRWITNTVSIHNGLNVITRAVGTWYGGFDLSASRKEVNRASAIVGDVITYSLRVQTASPASGAATLRDPLPAHTQYVTGSLSATSGTATYANGVISWAGQLTPHSGVYTNTTNDYQWGDSHGNGVVPGVTYDWIEIEKTGRSFAIYNVDSDGCYHTAFPFDFTYYTQVYTQAAISANGTLYFPPYYNGVLYPMSPDNAPIPGTNSYHGYSFGRFMAPFWDDLYLLPGWVYYQILGEAPHRKVVYEFAHVSRRAGAAQPGDTGTFEMIVFEDSSAILMQYKDVDFGNAAFDHGASATVGIQDSPELGTQYSTNEPAISDRLAILYVPPQRAITTTANFADITFAVTPDVVLPDGTPITNTVTLTSSLGQTITRAAATVYGVPDFSTSYLTSRQSIVKFGDTIDYDLHVINSGPVDGLLQVVDVVQQEPRLYYWSGSLDYPFGHGTDTNGVVEWTGLVPALSSATIHFGAYVNFDPTGQPPVSNTATLTNVATGAVYQRSVILNQAQPADLFVTTSGPGTIESTAPFTYTITYGNAGPFKGEFGPLITDNLPAGVSVVSFSPGGRQNSPNTVVWDFSPLTAETTYVLTVTVMPFDAPPGAVLTNSVTISDMAQDPDWSNDSDQWFTRVGAVPNLMNGTRKTVAPGGVGAAGDLATYTVHIVNSGVLTATAIVTDPLPLGLIYQAGSSRVGGVPTELYHAARNQIEWTGSIGPDQTLDLQFSVNAITLSDPLTNTVTLNDNTGIIVQRSAILRLLPWRLFLPFILK